MNSRGSRETSRSVAIIVTILIRFNRSRATFHFSPSSARLGNLSVPYFDNDCGLVLFVIYCLGTDLCRIYFPKLHLGLLWWFKKIENFAFAQISNTLAINFEYFIAILDDTCWKSWENVSLIKRYVFYRGEHSLRTLVSRILNRNRLGPFLWLPRTYYIRVIDYFYNGRIWRFFL